MNSDTQIQKSPCLSNKNIECVDQLLVWSGPWHKKLRKRIYFRSTVVSTLWVIAADKRSMRDGQCMPTLPRHLYWCLCSATDKDKFRHVNVWHTKFGIVYFFTIFFVRMKFKVPVYSRKKDNMTSVQRKWTQSGSFTQNFGHISVEGVTKLFTGLKPFKAAGPGELHRGVRKDLATEKNPMFASLFQQSLDTGELPREWSLAYTCFLVLVELSASL